MCDAISERIELAKIELDYLAADTRGDGPARFGRQKKTVVASQVTAYYQAASRALGLALETLRAAKDLKSPRLEK
jgi:hypothetical protein